MREDINMLLARIGESENLLITLILALYVYMYTHNIIYVTENHFKNLN